MARKYWLDLRSSLLIGLGIVVSSLVTVRASGVWVLAGPLLLAFAVAIADVLQSRRHGEAQRPSAAALMFAAAFALAGLIVMSSDPSVVRSLVPLMGAASWVALLPRSGSQRKRCTNI